jgi:polyisoprenoid-binding protein YceI
MNKIFAFSEVISLLALFTITSNKLHTDVYKVDTNLSTLEWTGEKITRKHMGTIKLSAGEIRDNHGRITGNLEIDMNTIVNTDVKTPDGRKKLEDHLKSEDFFHSALYPKSKFVITSVIPLNYVKPGPFTHTVKGMLTIKDKTNEISFDAKIEITDNKFTCTGTAIVDRSKFDVRHQSKTFFPDIGDKVVYDEFSLKFNIVATM